MQAELLKLLSLKADEILWLQTQAPSNSNHKAMTSGAEILAHSAARSQLKSSWKGLEVETEGLLMYFLTEEEATELKLYVDTESRLTTTYPLARFFGAVMAHMLWE